MTEFILILIAAAALLYPLLVFNRVYGMTRGYRFHIQWLFLGLSSVILFVSYVLLALSFTTEYIQNEEILIVVSAITGSAFAVVVAGVFYKLFKDLQREVDTKSAEAANLKDQFFYVAAHELRNPVTAMKWNLEVLENELGSSLGESQLQLLRSVEESNDFLAILVNDLLDTSSIEAGTFKINAEEVNLNELIRSVSRTLSFQADQKNIKIVQKEIPSKDRKVLADARRTKEVLMNLIGNAIKYNLPGGKIVISARHKGDFLEVKVKDDGIGLSEVDIETIFEKFTRVHRSETETEAGTGLGLYIVKQIVEKMGGELDVKSEGRNKGSVFIFTLPTVD